MRIRASRCLQLAGCWLLAGCGAGNFPPTTTELLSPPPQNYRDVIAARIGPNYNEPVIPESAEISEPFVGTSKLGASSMVCVRAPKAKDREPSVVAITFRSGEIVGTEFVIGGAFCRNAVFSPFPQLQAHYKTPQPPPPAVKAPPPPPPPKERSRRSIG